MSLATSNDNSEAEATFHAVSRMALGQWTTLFAGQRPCGFMHSFVPEELLHAAGFAPVLIQHSHDDSGKAKAHLPGFTCWVVRSALDQALTGQMQGWGGIVFGQSCDALLALSEIWERTVSDVPALFFGMPHHLGTPSARPYLLAELEQLRDRLGELAGAPVGDAALSVSIVEYNRRRRLVRRLYTLADRLQPTALQAALRAAFLMPVERYSALLAGLLEDLEGRAVPAEVETTARLVIVGSELADPTFYEVLSESPVRVVGDMLDLGYPHFAHDVNEADAPLEALAGHLLSLEPTPTKYQPQRQRGDALRDLVRTTQADGVVFARQKFCEPHGFDYVALKTALDGDNMPHLLIELEQTPHSGQMRTRLEAFLEMIGPNLHANRVPR